METLAEHLMDQAFYPTEWHDACCLRTGVIQNEVARLTTLLLLRLRFLVYERDDDTGPRRETLVWGYRGSRPTQSRSR